MKTMRVYHWLGENALEKTVGERDIYLESGDELDYYFEGAIAGKWDLMITHSAIWIDEPNKGFAQR